MKSYLAPFFSLFLYTISFADDIGISSSKIDTKKMGFSNSYAKEITMPFITNGQPYVGSIKLTNSSTSTEIYINEKRPEGEALDCKLIDALNDGSVDYLEQNYKRKELEKTFKKNRIQMSAEEREGADGWFKRIKEFVEKGLPLSVFEYNVDEE